MNPSPNQSLYRLRHSLAHILAEAVADLFGGSSVKYAGGPPTQDGFYYDFQLPRPLVPSDLEWLEAKMKESLKVKKSFIYEEVSPARARELFLDQPFKLEMIDGLSGGLVDEHGHTLATAQVSPISIYRHGDFHDLCKGPHVDSTEEIDPAAFKLLKIAGTYWRGDEKSAALQRIYGTAWLNKAELDSYLDRIEEAKRRDHRKLGRELDLFFFHPTAPGMPYWLPQGFMVLNQLITWWRQVHESEGYQEIASPLINSKQLWETSGHWQHYQNDMFVMEMKDGETYGVKPMNCPNAMIVFNHKHRSYRDLPLKLSDCDILHRHERSGTLHGLMRVQKFQQDDAHIFVADDESSIAEEYRRILGLVDQFYRVFGLGYRFRLATRPQDALGDDASWQRAEAALAKVLAEHSPSGYEIAKGDGAFYGPKIDILIKDAIGRDWQMGTIQLDFQLPRRFECQYVDRDGRKRSPAVIHRVIYGSLERFIGILLEHCDGKLPLWLAPIQVQILPIASRHEAFADEVYRALKANGIRADQNRNQSTMGEKMRSFRLAKIPYAVVIGDREVESRNLSIRKRGSPDSRTGSVEDFLCTLTEEISNKR